MAAGLPTTTTTASSFAHAAPTPTSPPASVHHQNRSPITRRTKKRMVQGSFLVERQWWDLIVRRDYNGFFDQRGHLKGRTSLSDAEIWRNHRWFFFRQSWQRQCYDWQRSFSPNSDTSPSRGDLTRNIHQQHLDRPEDALNPSIAIVCTERASGEVRLYPTLSDHASAATSCN